MTPSEPIQFGLYLMTEKGLRALDAMLTAFPVQRIAYVVGARDSAVDDDYCDQIAARCVDNGVSFYERKKPTGLTARYSFAVSWRWLIRDEPNLIVLHDSILPRYRGFAPLPTALIKGEREIGVSALLAAAEYDKGDMVGRRVIPISYPIKIKTAIELIAAQYGDLIVQLCNSLLGAKPLQTNQQLEEEASYSLWRDEEDYRIDWSRSASFIKRFIDSLGAPYKGASSFLGDKLVRILDAEIETDVEIEDRHPGKVIFLRQGFPIIVCGIGLLRITDLRDDQSGAILLPFQKFRVRFR